MPEAVPSHIIETVDTTLGVLCDAIFVMAHYIEGHPHIEILQLTQEITADPTHTLHISQVRKLCISLHPILTELQ